MYVIFLQAFAKAWEGLCGANEGTTPTLVVPADHTFFVREITFEGPCQSKQVHVQVQTLNPCPIEEYFYLESLRKLLHFYLFLVLKV